MSKAEFRFASIQRPSFRYRIYESSDANPAYDWRRANYCLSTEISQYDTMGDGEVQHSPDCLVQTEDCMDVIESLVHSLHLMRIDIDDSENCESRALRWFWRGESSLSDKLIQFCLGVKYNDKKDQYFTLHDGGKVSSSESKRYDKRWSKLERPNDGDCEIDRVLKMINAEGSPSGDKPNGTFQLIATVIRIAELLNDCGTYAAQMWLKRGPGVFKGVESQKLCNMICYFKYITEFKNSVFEVRRTREWSRERARKLQEASESLEMAMN